MGITSQIERGELSKMVILLILLVSPAFGRPSSDRDVGTQIGNQVDDIRHFSNETGKMLRNSSLTEEVIKMLLEAEQTILKMTAELKTLQTEEMKFKDNYFPNFNKAKAYLRRTRQDLRKLADRTVKDVRDMKVMLEAIDETTDSSAANLFLKISMNRMKDLMIETLETLKKAKGKYNSALETFDNLNTSIKKQNIQMNEFVTNSSTWIEKTREGLYSAVGATTVGLIIADVFGCLGLCSAVGAVASGSTAAATEKEVAIVIKKIEKLKFISDEMLRSGKNFDKAINVAIDLLENEIEIIGKWTQSAKIVSDNIEEYPVETLRLVKSFRTIFITGLDDLKMAAEEFLAQPENILTLEDDEIVLQRPETYEEMVERVKLASLLDDDEEEEVTEQDSTEQDVKRMKF